MPIIDAMTPHLLELVSLAILAVLSWGTALLRARVGLDISKRQQELIHLALMSGVRAALQNGLTGEDAVAAAVGHARVSVPDAIKALETPDMGTVLRTIARAKLVEAAGGK